MDHQSVNKSLHTKLPWIAAKRLRTLVSVLATVACIGLLAGCHRDKAHSAEFFIFGTIMEV